MNQGRRLPDRAVQCLSHIAQHHLSQQSLGCHRPRAKAINRSGGLGTGVLRRDPAEKGFKCSCGNGCRHPLVDGYLAEPSALSPTTTRIQKS